MKQQLALAIKLTQDTTLENLCWQGNEMLRIALLNSLNAVPPLPMETYYLWGASGTGKSHLLQACCNYLSSKGLASAYIPLSQLKTHAPAMLDGVETLRLVCIDDIDQIVTDQLWEEAIFHLYNRIHDNGHSLMIIAGNAAPTALNLKLADLASRLGWGMVFHLKLLDEAAKLNVLSERAQQLGLELTPAVGKYLINRCARHLSELINILEQLDQASLAAQRKLTIPFVKQELGL